MLSYLITTHADAAILERGIPIWVVRSTVENPEQIIPKNDGTAVYQKRFEVGDKLFLIRVPIDVTHDPPKVITAHRTSKIKQYWDNTGKYDAGESS